MTEPISDNTPAVTPESSSQAPESTTFAGTNAAAAGGSPGRRQRLPRAHGVGAMGPRVRRDDEPAPPREVVDAAATAARTTGHRFDLMRYLRLRRKQ